jgi:hypothetical protein
MTPLRSAGDPDFVTTPSRPEERRRCQFPATTHVGRRVRSAFATRRLARLAGILFARIAFVGVTCAGYIYSKVQQERSIEVVNRDFDQSSSDLTARMIAAERKIRSDVYQAQQFLADAPGANDPKHLTDALSGMQALAAQFASDTADAKGVAETYGGPHLVAVYSDVEQRFGEYPARSSVIGKAH